jgi:hypothetical protein
MNRIAIAAALSFSSLFAPLAAHADPMHFERGRVETRQGNERTRVVVPPTYTAPVVARPVYAQPVYTAPTYAQPAYAPQTVTVRRAEHDGWRAQRGHEIRDGRMRFEHGRR